MLEAMGFRGAWRFGWRYFLICIDAAKEMQKQFTLSVLQAIGLALTPKEGAIQEFMME